MKNILLPLAAVSFCTWSFAAPIIDDRFDYTVGEQLDDENAAWTPDNDGTGISVVAPAFSDGATPFAQTGNSIQLTSGRNTHLDITTVADTDYFFSYSIQPGTFNGATGTVWKGLFLENGSSDLFAGFDENGKFITQAHTSPVEAASFTAVAGNEYFVLGKASFGNDTKTFTISASVFDSAIDVPLTEPVSWDSTDSFTYGVSQSALSEYRFQSRGGTSQFDDALFSTAYADVIPEPSTYALLGGLLSLGSVLIRRRR